MLNSPAHFSQLANRYLIKCQEIEDRARSLFTPNTSTVRDDLVKFKLKIRQFIENMGKLEQEILREKWITSDIQPRLYAYQRQIEEYGTEIITHEGIVQVEFEKAHRESRNEFIVPVIGAIMSIAAVVGIILLHNES